MAMLVDNVIKKRQRCTIRSNNARSVYWQITQNFRSKYWRVHLHPKQNSKLFTIFILTL